MAEEALDRVNVGNEALDNVLHFEYLDSQLHGDKEVEADPLVDYIQNTAQYTSPEYVRLQQTLSGASGKELTEQCTYSVAQIMSC